MLAALLALALAGCRDETDIWHDTPEAVRTVYRDGVPHTDRHGRLRRTFDPARSFLPIGLYHALVGRHFGREYGLSAARAAGFDLIYPWEGQEVAPVTAAAKVAGLAVISADPTDAELRRDAADPDSPVIAWTLDQEPSRDTIRGDGWRERLARFRARLLEIHALDPRRPVTVIDAPDFTGAGADRWAAWATAGDISSHFNYPIRTTPPESLSTTRGLPQSVARAVALNHERKPVWLVVQAFGSPAQHWAMPTPAELRAMIYAGFVHGATGVIYFALDSFVTRDDGVIGMAPDPAANYNSTPDFNHDGKPPAVADAAQLAASRALWREAARINGELATLRPALLSPTSSRPYRVAILGQGNSRAPVRTMLKEWEGAATLIAVNVDDVPVTWRVRFDSPVTPSRAVFDSKAAPASVPNGWTDRLPAFGVRVYRFRFE